MRLVLLGDAGDARGFRLAGVESIACRTRADVDRAVESLLGDDGRGISVVLVSEPVSRLAPDLIKALQERPRWPIVAVLPEHGDGERRVA